MDSDDSKEDGAKARRRSIRQPSSNVLRSADLKPRPALKRTRKVREDDAVAVNGSKESKSLAEGDNDESPSKMRRLQEAEVARDGNEGADGDQADVEMDENVEQDEDMNSEEEAEQEHGPSMKLGSSVNRIYAKRSADVREEYAEPGPMLRSRRSIHKPVDCELKMGPTAIYSSKPSIRELSNSGVVPVQLKTLENQEGLKKRSNIKYQNHTEEKARDVPRASPPGSWNKYQASEPRTIIVYNTNNIPIRQQPPQLKNTELKNVKKPQKVTSKANPASTSRGCTWYMWKLLLLSMIFGLLAVGWFSYSLLCRTDMVQPYITEKFDVEIAALQLLFPSQRSVFWTRSAKHLRRHLHTDKPTEPVSLILTAGFRAERTMACLARSLAAAYSPSLNNSSIFEIDGTTKTTQDSDQVKLDIDTALKEAFEGNKSAAIVHRFEELPSGSTLIFYRYCDHENAAYKKVFLAFTVMLSVDNIDVNTSLSRVEDMVHDRIKEKFISSDKSAVFNQMDVDKLSGLWSRISHLILPVVPEEKIEQQGCGPD